MPWLRIMPRLTWCWASSRSRPTARHKASPKATGLSLDRNLAAAHAWIGIAKVYTVRAEETEAHIRDALRLSPRYAGAFRWLHFIGVTKMHLKRLRGRCLVAPRR